MGRWGVFAVHSAERCFDYNYISVVVLRAPCLRR